MEREVFCAGCGIQVEDDLEGPAEARTPCAACGSIARNAHIHVQDEIKFHEALTLRQKRPGFVGRSGKSRGGMVREVFQGEEQSADGSWVHKVRIKDREANRYTERVVAQDGTVLHDVDEPFTEHTGHGSDKARTEPQE